MCFNSPAPDETNFKEIRQMNSEIKSRIPSQEGAIVAGQSLEEKKYWLEKLSGELVQSCFTYDKLETNINPQCGRESLVSQVKVTVVGFFIRIAATGVGK